MQILRKSYQIKGFVRINRYGLWLRSMEQTISGEARRRAKILIFWRAHGLKATQDAFNVGRSTLYGWQAEQRKADGGVAGLNPGSRRPHQVRRREWPEEVLVEIKRLRTMHPNLGKDKIAVVLKSWCAQRQLRCPKARTIGRIIADAPDKMRRTPQHVSHFGKVKRQQRQVKEHKPKGFVATYPGQCGAFDTVERIVHGSRRYIITFTDLYSRFAFAHCTTSHAALAAKEVFDLVCRVFPFPLDYVLTDNGSEFMKEFDAELKRLHRVHWHTYPRTPKMNAHVERFNRTIQEEFVDYHLAALLDPPTFNIQLIDYLLWFNLERPHFSLHQTSPVQFLLNQPQQSSMYWPHTLS